MIRAERSGTIVRQRGLTIIATILILVAVGLVALLAIKIVPIYLDYNNVRSTIGGLRDDARVRSMSRTDARTALQRRFDIGYVNIIKATDLDIREQGPDLLITVDYEDRRNVVANVDVVVHFKETFRITR